MAVPFHAARPGGPGALADSIRDQGRDKHGLSAAPRAFPRAFPADPREIYWPNFSSAAKSID